MLSSVYPWKWQPSQRWISTEGAVTRRTQASVGASNDQVTLGIRPHRRCQGVFCWHAFGSNCNNYSALAWTIFALESSVLPSFYRDLKSAKLPNLGPTWAQHGPSIPQHRPNMDPKSSNMPQHRPNMGPSMCPTLPNIEPTWAQHTPNMHPTKAKHRTYYGSTYWNSVANPPPSGAGGCRCEATRITMNFEIRHRVERSNIKANTVHLYLVDTDVKGNRLTLNLLFKIILAFFDQIHGSRPAGLCQILAKTVWWPW